MNDTQPKPPTFQIGRYEIVTEIGRGGMGVVYRAYEPSLDRLIALKVLAPPLDQDPRFVARLQREAINTARLRHPNIALLYEFGQVDGTTFLAMEYVPGVSLRQLLAQGLLPIERTLNILGQIAQALDYAHRVGIVHRDVKPSNILVGPGDHAMLIDFGLSDMAETSLLTADSSLLGTPQYMAPEQAAGRGADSRTDQYALAAIAYEMLTGVPPFHSRHAAAIVHAHLYETPAPANEVCPTLPQTVDAVVQRGLAKAPHERYPSLTAFINDLRAALTVRVRRPRRITRHRLALGGIATIVLAVTLALWQPAVFSESAVQANISAAGRSGVPLPQQIIWQYDPDVVGGPPLVLADGSLVVGTLDGGIVALRADTGDRQWHKGGDTIYGAPSVSNGLIVVGGANESVLGLSLEKGGLIWQTRVTGAVDIAPIIAGDRVVVTTDKGYVYVLQSASGQVIWSRPLELGAQAPLLGADRIFVSVGRALYALDLQSGVVDWEFEAAGTITTQPVLDGDNVLIGTERGTLQAIAIAGGNEQFRYAARGSLRAAPAIGEQLLFVVDQAGSLTALSADGRRVEWRFDAGAAITATPVLADGKLLFGASNGVVYALDARRGRLLSRLQLNGSIETPVILGDGVIYVRADQIYALGS